MIAYLQRSSSEEIRILVSAFPFENREFREEFTTFSVTEYLMDDADPEFGSESLLDIPAVKYSREAVANPEFEDSQPIGEKCALYQARRCASV